MKHVLRYQHSQIVPSLCSDSRLWKFVRGTWSARVSTYELSQESPGLNPDKKAEPLVIQVDNGWVQVWV